MAYNGKGNCSECYESGYRDAFETIIEHYKSEHRFSRHGEKVVAEVGKLLKDELSS